jgi:hypothetical protein
MESATPSHRLEAFLSFGRSSFVEIAVPVGSLQASFRDLLPCLQGFCQALLGSLNDSSLALMIDLFH